MGPCEWCGGPQHWTLFEEEVYASCDSGCLPIPGVDVGAPPGIYEKPDALETEMEHPEESRVSTPESGAADRDIRSVLVHVGVPLEAVLRNLWEGDVVDHGET